MKMRIAFLVSVVLLVSSCERGEDFSRYEESDDSPPSQSRYSCAGKEYCSEMTSCEEATFYLKNCPDTKMDGDNDGIPCESQWCN